MKFKVGDKVKLNPEIENFRYGRGGVGYEELGTITGTDKYLDITVDFPTMRDWSGIENELILVSTKSKKTFFKKLPNDYTGTLEVKNGYIVEKEILDEKEKEYLLAVIRPFKNKVDFIRKAKYFNDNSDEYIQIHYHNNGIDYAIQFPNFRKGTMYKGMELAEKYTLKELGLFEEN